MANPSNLYAEKIFAEHPLSLWALDDDMSYVSFITEEQRGNSFWMFSEGASLAGNPLPESIPFENSNTLSVQGPAPTGAFETMYLYSLLPSAINQTETTFGAYLYDPNGLAISYGIGYAYDNGGTPEFVVKNFGVPTTENSWILISETFRNIPSPAVSVVIQITYAASPDVLNPDFFINGITAGYQSEEFLATSLGTELSSAVDVSIGSDSSDVVLGIQSPSYGLVDNPAYYCLDPDLSPAAKNTGIPMVYGSQNVTRLYGNQDNPSLVIPSSGFMHKDYSSSEYTAEFWIRAATTKLASGKIFGPTDANSGIYIDSEFVRLKVGNKFASYYVGNWFRPMLFDVKISPRSASLLINAEEVISIELDKEDFSELSSIGKAGFFVPSGVDYLEIDAVAIYSYLITTIIAKRRMVYAQAVESPDGTSKTFGGKLALIDYSVADYTSNYSYPDIGKFNQGIGSNITINRSSLSAPDYPAQNIQFKSSNLESLIANSSSQDPVLGYSGLNLAKDTSHLKFDSFSLSDSSISGMYGVFGANSVEGMLTVSSPDSYWTNTINADFPTVTSGKGEQEVELNAFAYGNGVYVAVGPSYFGHSSDGINWTYTPDPGGTNLYAFSVVFGNGVFLATYGDGIDYYSTDGINWTSTSVPASGVVPEVFFSGSHFFAFSTSPSSTISKSSDGVTWQPVGTSGNYPYGYPQSVAENSAAIILATDQSRNIRRYEELTGSWELVEISGDSPSIEFVVSIGDKFFAISTTGDCYMSLDGLSWTLSSSVAPLATTFSFSSDLRKASVQASTEALIVLANTDNGREFFYSKDGVEWTSSSDMPADISYYSGLSLIHHAATEEIVVFYLSGVSGYSVEKYGLTVVEASTVWDNTSLPLSIETGDRVLYSYTHPERIVAGYEPSYDEFEEILYVIKNSDNSIRFASTYEDAIQNNMLPDYLLSYGNHSVQITQEQTLVLISNKANGDTFRISLVDGGLRYSSNISSIYTEMLFEPGIATYPLFTIGFSIDNIKNYFSQYVGNFFDNVTQLEMYVGSNPDFSDRFVGTIYRFGLCDARNYSQISEYFLAYTDEPFDVGSIELNPNGELSFWSLILDGGSPESQYNVSDIMDHIASYTIVVKNTFGILSLDIATSSSWQDSIALSHFAQYVSSGSSRYYDIDFIQFNIDYPSNYNLESGSFDTSGARVKTYISFQTKASGANSALTSFSNIKSLESSRTIFPGNDWLTTAYEVVDRTIIYMPKDVDLETLSIVTHIELAIDGVNTNPISIKRIEYASQAFNDDTANPIGTKYAVNLYPYIKYGSFFDYRGINPHIIYKRSTPHLYLTDSSGIEIVGESDQYVSRGVLMQVNEFSATSYRIKSLQAFIKPTLTKFSAIPSQIFEIETASGLIKFFVKKADLEGKRGKIYAIYSATGMSVNGIAYYLNGKLTKSPIITINEWSAIGLSFATPLNFDSFVGAVRISGNILFNAISFYESSKLEEIERQSFRSWNQVRTGEVDGTPANFSWEYTLGPMDGTTYNWGDILIVSATDYYGADISSLYGSYTGTNKLVLDDNHITSIGASRFVIRNGITKTSTIVSPV